MALIVNVPTGQVEGQFVVGVVDGDGENSKPHYLPARGQVVFTATAPYIPNPVASPNPVTMLKKPVVALLDNEGYLCTPTLINPEIPGRRGIRLAATDNTSDSVKNWTWEATPQFVDEEGATIPGTIPTFTFALPGNSTVDLTTVVKVPASPGLGTEQVEALAGVATTAAKASAAEAEKARLIAKSIEDRANAGEFKGDQGVPGPNTIPTLEAVAGELAAQSIVGPLGQYELQPYVNMGDSWSDPVRVNVTPGASLSERLARRLGTGPITHRGYSSRTMEDLANITLSGPGGWVTGSKSLVTITSCHLNNTKYLGTGPAAERSYKHAWRALLSTLTAKAAVAANTDSFVYSAGWTTEVTSGTTLAQAASNSTGGTRFRTTKVGSYALVKVTGRAVDIYAVARIAGAGLMTVTDDSSGATLGTLDLRGTTAQDTPAVLSLRNLGTGTRTLRITHTSGASLTLDSIRIPATDPTRIILAPAPDTSEGGSNTLPAGDPSPSYNAAQATARQWMTSVSADYPSVSICDLNQFGFHKTNDFYTDRRHLNDRGAAKWASVIVDHLKGLDYIQGLNMVGNDEAGYINPSPPRTPTGGQNGTGMVPYTPAARTFQDSSREWLFTNVPVGIAATRVYDSVNDVTLSADSEPTAPRVAVDNGLRFLRFRGTDANPDYLVNVEDPRPERETIAMLFRYPAALEGNRRYLLASGLTNEIPQSVMGRSGTFVTFVMNEGTTLTLSPAYGADNAWHVGVFVRNGNESVIRIDGAEVIGDAGIAATKTGFRLARNTASEPASSTRLDVGALITFPYAASATQREAIIAKLTTMIPSDTPNPGQTIADSFNRGDTTIGLGLTSTGSFPWLETGGAWGITSGQAYRTAGPPAQGFATLSTGFSDGTITTKVTAMDAAHSGGIVFRSTDISPGSDAYVVSLRGSTADLTYSLFQRTGGVNTKVAASQVTPAPGDVIKVQMSGASITVSVNGTVLHTYTDTAYVSNTRHGLYANSAAGETMFDSIELAPAR